MFLINKEILSQFTSDNYIKIHVIVRFQIQYMYIHSYCAHNKPTQQPVMSQVLKHLPLSALLSVTAVSVYLIPGSVCVCWCNVYSTQWWQCNGGSPHTASLSVVLTLATKLYCNPQCLLLSSVPCSPRVSNTVGVTPCRDPLTSVGGGGSQGDPDPGPWLQWANPEPRSLSPTATGWGGRQHCHVWPCGFIDWSGEEGGCCLLPGRCAFLKNLPYCVLTLSQYITASVSAAVHVLCIYTHTHTLPASRTKLPGSMPSLPLWGKLGFRQYVILLLPALHCGGINCIMPAQGNAATRMPWHTRGSSSGQINISLTSSRFPN